MKSKISSYITKIKTFLVLPVFIYAENLILDGETIVLDGAHTFETISLQNNSKIHVDSTTSKLILFCDSLYICFLKGN